MKIVIHLGAHCTDEDRLLSGLIANRDALRAAGIDVPAPRAYRPAMRETLARLRGAPAPEEATRALLQAMHDVHSGDTVVIGSEGFVCAPRFVLGQRRIYPMIGDRLQALCNLFPGYEIRFTLGLRNPATLIPALHEKVQADIPFEALIAPVDLAALRWSETVATMRQAAPQAEITLWCNEDRALIWPEILRAVSGHPSDLRLQGTEDILAPLLKPGGMDRLHAYLAERPDLPEAARRRVIDVFLDKFGDPDALETTFDLPAWPDTTVWELSRAYEMDLDRIAAMPDVTLLRP